MKQRSKMRGLKFAALLAATSALAGCYYEPGYYTRGDAYYGTDYYYDSGADYAPGYYAPGYYGGYWPGYYYGPSIGLGYYYYDYRHRGWRDHDRIGRGSHGGWPPVGADGGARMPPQMPGARSSPGRGMVPSAPQARSGGTIAPSRGSVSPPRGGVGRSTRSH